MLNYTVPHRVSTYRAAGLEARWTKSHTGAPFIAVRNPNATRAHQRETWWMVDRSMHDMMGKHGIMEGFNCSTMLGDIFSVVAR